MTEKQEKLETLARQEAFDKLLEGLKSEVQHVLSDLKSGDKLDTLEGFRHVLRVLSFARDIHHEP